MKRCTKCGNNKPEEAFRLRKRKNSDQYYLNGACLECENADRAAYREKKKAEAKNKRKEHGTLIGKERVREDGFILCNGCKEYKKSEDFNNDKKSPIGVHNHCKNCRSNKRKVDRLNLSTKDMARYCFLNTKNRAQKANKKFTITEQDIIIPEICPYLGIPIQMSDNRDEAPSVDRIDNTQGYVPGNIQVISYKANRCKNDLDNEALVLFAKNVLKLHS